MTNVLNPLANQIAEPNVPLPEGSFSLSSPNSFSLGDPNANAYATYNDSLGNSYRANAGPSLANSSLGGGADSFFGDNGLGTNIGKGMGLAGGALSLANMINNWGLQKKALKLNMSNVRQQMDQSRKAFDRSVDRQDANTAAVADVNARARNIQQG